MLLNKEADRIILHSPIERLNKELWIVDADNNKNDDDTAMEILFIFSQMLKLIKLPDANNIVLLLCIYMIIITTTTTMMMIQV